MLAGQIAGCAPDQAAFQPPTPPPQIEGYDDRYWEWDEEDGEWEYNPPDGGVGIYRYFYGGKLHKSSAKFDSAFRSSYTSGKSVSSKMSGFGSGSKGGFFGG